MKLKILVKLIEKLLGKVSEGDAPRADMYMPERALAMALVFLAGGTAFGIYACINPGKIAIIAAIAGLGLGIALLLCWRNQSIRVISDEQFTYTTMFGNTRTYNFADIQGLRQNKDSLTLFVAGEKVHMESMAIISERLANLINGALEELNEKA